MTRHTAPVTTIDPPEPGPPTTPQHPLAVSIVLHLLPGAALVTFVLVTAPVVRSLGLPPLFAMFAGIGLVIAPLELGYLAVQARRTTGSWSPLAAVHYRTSLPLRRLGLLAAGLAAWFMVFLVTSMALLDEWLAQTVFAWLPATLLEFSTVDDGEALAGAALVALLAVAFVFNGVVGPVTEELYFRGHLLPRIDRYGPGRRCSTPSCSASTTSGRRGGTRPSSSGSCR